MTYNKISDKISSNKQKYSIVHTAFRQGIAVFFCSTGYTLFALYSFIYDLKFKNCALVFERVRFFYVIKRVFMLFYNRRQTKAHKPCIADSKGYFHILSEWQAFIGRYP